MTRVTHKKLRIGIDARLSGDRHAGIGRYIQNLLIQLNNLSPNNIQLIFFFHDQQQEKSLAKNLKKSKNYASVFAPIRHYSFAEQTKWPVILNKHQLDLLHVPHFNIPLLYKGKLVITIHDLLWHEQIGPEATTLSTSKYYLKYLAYRLVTSQALARAKTVFVPTNTVKQALANYKPQLKPKIVTTYEGISEPFLKIFKNLSQQPEKAFKKSFDLSLIYVGSLYPHKNIEIVLQTLKQMPELKLTIVCARNVFMKRTQQRIKKLNLTKQVTLTGFLADKELITKIQSSLALIQPSKSEGFGLTAIEAMAVGTPVIASNLKVFKELYLDAPLYFNPNDAQQLKKQILQLQQDSIRKQHIKRGLRISKKYSWAKMAQTTLDHYLSILN
jgi:glycosyltransferase involved in cell wall biosynthesis